MSRVGQKPIAIPEGVQAQLRDRTVLVKGPRGELSQAIPPCCDVVIESEQVLVRRNREDKQARALHGTIRSLIYNMTVGVSKGFAKELNIVGMGYRAALQGNKLVLNLGFSHQIEYVCPQDIDIEVPDATTIRVSGCDKQKVGEAAAEIRRFRKPEPYKGKGIRYKDEIVRLKVGKAALGSQA